jgi:hypothetical protein
VIQRKLIAVTAQSRAWVLDTGSVSSNRAHGIFDLVFLCCAVLCRQRPPTLVQGVLPNVEKHSLETSPTYGGLVSSRTVQPWGEKDTMKTQFPFPNSGAQNTNIYRRGKQEIYSFGICGAEYLIRFTINIIKYNDRCTQICSRAQHILIN